MTIEVDKFHIYYPARTALNYYEVAHTVSAAETKFREVQRVLARAIRIKPDGSEIDETLFVQINLAAEALGLLEALFYAAGRATESPEINFKDEVERLKPQFIEAEDND